VDDPEAAMMRGLYAEHGAALWRYALRLTGDQARAEDVVQETLLRAWRHPEVTDEVDRSARAWLFTVARHLYISYLRSRMLEDSVVSGLTALWPVSPPRASPFETAAATELERRLERALAALPLASREVLLLVGVAGLDQSDAADVCGITPAALRQRLLRDVL